MWENKKLKEIAVWGSGGTPKSTNPNYYDGNIPWLIIGDLNDGLVTSSEKKITEDGLNNSSAKLVAPDSVLIAMYGSIGKLGINKIEVATNQAIAFTKSISDEVYNIYLFYYLLSKRRDLHDLGKGGTQQNISQTVLKEVEIPVPPLPTQHRIVEKIEELFSELDNGVENLKKAQKQLKTYRQAVLKDAFEGKLTKEWREQQDNLPTPGELLEQIKAERNAHRQHELAEWEKEVEQWEEDGEKGKKPTKPRKSRSVDKLTQNELSELHDLPENWFWGKINDITLRVEYGTSNKSLDEGEIPVLRMGNMQNGKIDWNDLKYSDDPKDNEDYLLQDQDVLFNRTNSPELVGKAVIYKGEQPAIFAGYLIRLNQIREVMNGYYLNYFLNSVTAKNHGNKVKTDGVNQSNINGTKLVNYPIPLCSKKEQDQIVQEIESRLSVIDQLEQTIKENLQKAEALRQSILKKAFSGKLVE